VPAEDSGHIQNPKFGVLFASICRAPLRLQRMLPRARCEEPVVTLPAPTGTVTAARWDVRFGQPSEVKGGERKLARCSRTHSGEGKGKWFVQCCSESPLSLKLKKKKITMQNRKFKIRLQRVF